MLDIRPINTELQLIAMERLNEIPERIEDALKEFKEWIRSTPHLKARTDDQFLIAFLRSSKYDLDKAKRQLDIYYTVRSQTPEFMMSRDPTNSKINAVIKLGFGIPLPNTETEGGPRYFLIRPGSFDPSLFSIQDVIKVCTMINDIQMRCDDNWIVAGQIGILDLANVQRGHLNQLNPSVIKKMTLLSQESYPVNHCGFHYLNNPQGFEQIFSVFLSCMTEEKRSRVFVHGNNLDSLYKIVPRRLMPKEYGGEAGSLKEIIKDWEEKIFFYRQYFEEEEEQYGVDESKRPKDGFNPNSLFQTDDQMSETFLKP